MSALFLFFSKIYVYKLVHYQVSTYVNHFFLSFRTYVHELVFNRLYVYKFYLHSSLFLSFFSNICIYLSYFLRNFSFSSKNIPEATNSRKEFHVRFSKVESNSIKANPVKKKVKYPFRILSNSTDKRITILSLNPTETKKLLVYEK